MGQISSIENVNMDNSQADDTGSEKRTDLVSQKRRHEAENTVTLPKKTKTSNTGTDARKMIKFMSLVGELKRVPRTGWVRNKVKDPESVSDHMYRMAIMAMLITPQDSLNKDRCVKIALVHDMAECIVGDITPWDGINKDEKHQREEAAMKRLSGLVGEETGKELFDLWEEYEYQKSPEAQFVKDLDKFEMTLQAYEYETQQKGKGELQEFIESTKGKFKHPTVQGWVQELYQVRNETSNDPSSRQEEQENTQQASS